jgi:AraC-like DNA-binding protein
MDVLTDALEAIHMKSVIHGRLELTAPWGVRIDAGRSGFLVVTRGTCWMEVAGADEPFQLAGGDYVLLPGGQAHVLKDSPSTPARPAAEVFGGARSAGGMGCQPGGIHHYGGGGALTTIVGGCFFFEGERKSPLVESLPPVVHVKGDGGPSVQWLETSLQFVASEMALGLPGAETVVSRLADILFVQAVRSHLVQAGETRGWLRALVDPQIGAALSLIHERPQDAWTVQSLAERVAMSRSAFAARFADLVEEPPLTYVARWRMDKASRLLRTTRASIGEIAGKVGYDAEAAFSKAFKRWMGMPPGAYRRAQGGPGVA